MRWFCWYFYDWKRCFLRRVTVILLQQRILVPMSYIPWLYDHNTGIRRRKVGRWELVSGAQPPSIRCPSAQYPETCVPNPRIPRATPPSNILIDYVILYDIYIYNIISYSIWYIIRYDIIDRIIYLILILYIILHTERYNFGKGIYDSDLLNPKWSQNIRCNWRDSDVGCS